MSRISAVEMQGLHDQLHDLYLRYVCSLCAGAHAVRRMPGPLLNCMLYASPAVSRYKDEEQGISSAGLTKFAVDGGLINKTLPESEVVLIFSSVKLGKKTVLNYDRFQEACRKMAGKSGCTYQVRRRTHARDFCLLFPMP